MNFKAIGLLELSSVAVGLAAADAMIKAAAVEMIQARTACPGRYLVLVAGDTGSVQSSVQVGRQAAGEFLVDWFVIPNVHPDVFPALSCATPAPRIGALGVIETYSSASCILAADAAAKAGQVELIEIRCATGLAGKSFVTLTGDVGSVQASVEAGVAAVQDTGLVMSHVVIPALSPELKAGLV
ncbi:MAG: BMC domain-containing protein [Thermodesulfobacteriota bacterium]